MQRLKISVRNDLPDPKGWYLVELTPRDAARAPARLCSGSPQGTRGVSQWPLAPAGGGVHAAVVYLADASDELWLESDDASEPADLRVRRLGRLGAMARMLRSLRTGSGRFALVPALQLAGAAALGGPWARAQVVAHYRGRPQIEQRVGAGRRLAWRNDAVLVATHHLVPEFVPAAHALAPPLWHATGDDPSFRLQRGGAALRLAAGWYRLRMRIDPAAGNLSGPCLYPDYGDGCLQSEMIPLPAPRADGVVDAVVVFKADVRALRFDPSTRRGHFLLRRFSLRPMGRLPALLAMLTERRHAGGRRDWAGSVRAMLRFVRDARASGISHAARELYLDAQGRNGSSGHYADWVARFDTFDAAALRALRQRAEQLPAGPLFSLLMPTYQTPERWLRRALDSVLAQAYPHWELCIVDDGSPSAHVREILREYAARDRRIRVSCRASNGHISVASNDALAMAQGQFIGLLDHDDELRPHALLEMAEAIQARPGVQLLYSDEDKIDEHGRRFHPYFKPDWNPDLLLSQNYVCHFTVVDAALVRRVGGFRVGFEGSQDHDLVLRCCETLAAGQIAHVPKVLYHWRAIAGSTALARSAKDYASAAGVRAVAEHLARTGAAAMAEELAHGHYRVRWQVPHPAPKVSVIVPTRDRLELLRTCVDSVLERTRYPAFELVVVDNQSSEPAALAYLAELEATGRARVLRYDRPFNYSAINNWAVGQCDGEVLCLLNNDIEVISEDWLAELVGHALRPQVGAVGALLYYPDDTIQHAGVILGLGGIANHAYAGQARGHAGHGARAKVAQNLTAVTGACLVVRRDRYLQVGGLDEQLQVAFNDIDFCLKLCRAGYRNVWTPFAELYHHESASRGRDDSPEKAERFMGEVRLMESRWGDWLHADPAYNPNLSLSDMNSTLAFPPRVAGPAPALERAS